VGTSDEPRHRGRSACFEGEGVVPAGDFVTLVGEYRRAEPAGAQGSGTLVRSVAVVEADLARRVSAAGSHQPQVCPLFCSASHLRIGAKYSISALASPLSSPLMAFIASGHGLLAPISSMALSFAPASLLP